MPGIVMTAFTGSIIEQAALDLLRSIGRQILYGPDIVPDVHAAERDHPRDFLDGIFLIPQ